MCDVERAFLAAIRDRPADDLPRLAYADWLDERGEAGRAEFIWVQCVIAAAGPAPVTTAELVNALTEGTPPHPTPVDLAAREADSRGEMTAWVDEQVPGGCRLHYRRGLPVALVLDGPEQLSCAEAALTAFPIVGLFVRQFPAVAERLSALPCVNRIEVLAGADEPSCDDLDFGDPAEYEPDGANILPAIAAGRDWERLHTITLPAYRLTTAGVAALAASPVARRLERLSLSINPEIGDAGIAALAAAIDAARFRELDIGDVGVTDDGVVALARAAGMARVERLSVNDPFGGRGLAALAAARFDRLDDLHLVSSLPDDVSPGILALADATFRPRKLTLIFEQASEAAWLALCHSGLFAGLEVLQVCLRPGQRQALSALVSSPQLGRLKAMSINIFAPNMPDQDWVAAGDEIATLVANDFALPALERLSLFCHCGDGGAVAFLSSQQLPPTIAVQLHDNGDWSAGVRAAFVGRFGPGSVS